MSWPEYMWQQELLEEIIEYQKLLKAAREKDWRKSQCN